MAIIKYSTIDMQEVVRQSNSMTDACYRMTYQEKQLLYAILSMLNKSDLINNEEIEVVLFLQDFKKRSPKKITNHQAIIDASERLIQRKIIFNNSIENGSSIISSALYQAPATIRFLINRNFNKYLFDWENGYTQFSLAEALKFTSVYSQRIFEYLNRFKDTGIWNTTLSSFKKKLGIEDAYSNHSVFKERVIYKAQKELKEHAGVTFKYNEIRLPGIDYKLEFRFEMGGKKKIRRIDNPVPEEEDKVKLAKETLINRFGMAKSQTDCIFRQLPLDVIFRINYKLMLSDLESELRNKGGYAVTIFKKAGVKF